MSKNYFIRVRKAMQTRFWINNVTREEADITIAAGAVGYTQNPSYNPWKVLDNSKDSAYARELFNNILRTEKDERWLW